MEGPNHTGIFEIDAYAPAAVARRVESAGIAKAGLPALQTLVLGILAGAFIAFGAMTYTVVVTARSSASAPPACWAASRSRSV